MPNNSSPKDSLSYADSGVDIDAGNALVENIKRVTARTTRPEVLSRLGGFNALCELPGRYRQPVLVSATDGVGTKLKLATSGNRIIIAWLNPLPERGTLVSRGRDSADRLRRYDIPILEYPDRMSTAVDWDMSRRVLTDQFSPANLLRDF